MNQELEISNTRYEATHLISTQNIESEILSSVIY